MNYYPRYPGHYLSKTLHLTMEQDGAYNRFLDWYYYNERPIPHEQRYAIARAQSASEKKSADVVLREYFVRDGDEWRQARADEVIVTAQPKIASAKANGKLGGRPRKNPLGISEKPNGFLEETQEEPSAKAPQSPIPKRAVGEVTPPPPEFQAAEVGDGSPVALVIQLRQRGFGLTPSHPDLLSALAEGITPESILRMADRYPKKPIGYAIAAARGERGDSAERESKQAKLESRNRTVAEQWVGQEEGAENAAA